MKKIIYAVFLCLVVFILSGCISSVKKALFMPEERKAKITVADFEVKAAKADEELASALREKLISALLKNNRFLISEPALKQAELILTATLVEFEPQARSGGRSGIGGGGGSSSGEFGGLLGASINKTHVALEIRIADYANAQVFSTGRVQGQAGAGVSLDKAIDECINEAVRYILHSIPSKYYKY
ncbi:MAG: CsgG/HfaB family protein [Candidatus Omnitrophota bacterium]|jgi:predicted heme/steroid binding protein